MEFFDDNDEKPKNLQEIFKMKNLPPRLSKRLLQQKEQD
jgi:hypothetical protein